VSASATALSLSFSRLVTNLATTSPLPLDGFAHTVQRIENACNAGGIEIRQRRVYYLINIAHRLCYLGQYSPVESGSNLSLPLGGRRTGCANMKAA
jgi:hypothetical protein